MALNTGKDRVEKPHKKQRNNVETDARGRATAEITVPVTDVILNELNSFCLHKYTLRQKLYNNYIRLCFKLGLLKQVDFGLYKWFWLKD